MFLFQNKDSTVNIDSSKMSELNHDANNEVKVPLNPNANNLELYEVIFFYFLIIFYQTYIIIYVLIIVYFI